MPESVVGKLYGVLSEMNNALYSATRPVAILTILTFSKGFKIVELH